MHYVLSEPCSNVVHYIGNRVPFCDKTINLIVFPPLFYSSFSSFKFNFSPISLVDEILTGDEWSPFLSIRDSPAPSPSVFQSEVASQHGYDEGDQLKTGPELRLPNDVQHNHEDIGFSLYEAVSFSQSRPNEIVDNQSDNRQQEVDNNNDTEADAIAVIKPKILLENDAAEESELDHSRPISKDIHDSKSPIRNQSKDHLDFSCVKVSHTVGLWAL